MNSIILQSATRLIVQIMLLVSIIMLLRGHDYPGGGFIGALIACSAVALYYIAFMQHRQVQIQRFLTLIPCGLLCLLLSLVMPLCFGKTLLSALWFEFNLLGSDIKIGTPILFDIGVYLVILGAIAWLIKALISVSQEDNR